MTIQLYDTQRRTKAVLEPVDPAAVRMYVCGVTVYDYAHIGNARPVIVFDVLFRLLRHVYGVGSVRYARNITDVDDKINARAARDFPNDPINIGIRKVAEATERQFLEDVSALGCLSPSDQPRATEYIGEMSALIDRLLSLGFAYVAHNHALFSVAAMDRGKGLPKYGSLARRTLDEMLAGARVEVAPYKRDPMDFVLWKPSTAQEPGWPSPGGISVPGRPGWHIECSAMSMAKLLTPFGGGLQCSDPTKNVFDIHGGGIDLVFPHHENEVAQSCCALSAPRMANFFMHNGFLQVEGSKMSKSAGNFVTIDQLLRKNVFGGRSWPGAVLRFAMLRTHYRQPIDWTFRSLEESQSILEKFAAVEDDGSALPPSAELIACLSDDLNTPEAIAHLHGLLKASRDPSAGADTRARAAKQLRGDAGFLGINLAEVAASNDVASELRSQIEGLLARRAEARQAKNWPESDRIRAELSALGVVVKDSKDGSVTWTLSR